MNSSSDKLMQEVYRRLRTIVSVRHDIVYLVHIMQVLYQTYIDFVHDGDILNEFAVIYLFIINPQGYLPCAKLSMSFIRPPVLLLLRLSVASIVLQEFIFVHSCKLFFHSFSEWLSLTTAKPP